jgi:hypothetical protein
MHPQSAVRICKAAMLRGSVTAEQIGRTARAGKASVPALPKEEYDERWLKRVFGRCVQNENGCWIWQGPVRPKGYGYTSYRERSTSTHRAVYRLVYGKELKSDQFVCHTCDVPACCNPMHLVLESNLWNMADKTKKGRHHEQKVTHCPRNHPYDSENTRINASGSRSCKACSRIRQRIAGGWTPEEAERDVSPIPQNASTPRRRWDRTRKAA